MISTPRPPHRERVLGWPLWCSLAVHAAALLAFVLFLRLGPPASPVREATAPVEVVTYVDLGFPGESPQSGDPGVAEPPAEDAPTAGDAVAGPARRGEEERGLRFPTAVPRGVGAPAPGADAGAPQGGEAGGGGGVRGRLRPGYSDPRLYVDPGALRGVSPTGEKSDHQRYVEHLQRRIEAVNDSMAGAAREPDTDWTVKDKSGGKWGLSEKGLHLGGITVPRAVLPLPRATGTNQDQEKAREEQRQRDEIRRQEEDRERRRRQQESIDATRARRDRERSGGGDPGS